jgi:protein-disulfide isomerase
MNEAQSQPAPARRTLLLLLSAALLLAFGWMLAGSPEATAATPAAPAATDEVAIVAGQKITMAEVQAAAAEQLEQLDLQRQQMEKQLEQQRHSVLQGALGGLVEERLLALEAKERGLSTDQLVEQEVAATVTKVTPEEIDAFYNQLQQQRPGQVPPKESIAGQIEQHLQEQAGTRVRNEYMTTLRAKHSVEVLLEEPRTEVEVAGHPAKGPETAPVTIVEFSDFECPFCSRVVPTIDQVRGRYGDKVRIVFRQFPLNSIHPNAQKASEASLCANDQGKFWEMHDAMFADQKKLSIADLKATAARLGLDAAKFDACLDGGTYSERVAADVKAGSEAGVSGTPAIFINGRMLSGAQPFEALSKVIDEELARADRLARRGK